MQLVPSETIMLDKLHQHQCVRGYFWYLMSTTGAKIRLDFASFRFKNKC